LAGYGVPYRYGILQALRVQRLLRASGLSVLLLASAALMAGVDNVSTTLIFLAVMYGALGSVMLMVSTRIALPAGK
jgi:hypothetical protein